MPGHAVRITLSEPRAQPLTEFANPHEVFLLVQLPAQPLLLLIGNPLGVSRPTAQLLRRRRYAESTAAAGHRPQLLARRVHLRRRKPRGHQRGHRERLAATTRQGDGPDR